MSQGFPTPWASLSYFLDSRNFFQNQRFFTVSLGYKDMNSIHEIDSPVGAFFLSRKILEDLKGLTKNILCMVKT